MTSIRPQMNTLENIQEDSNYCFSIEINNNSMFYWKIVAKK